MADGHIGQLSLCSRVQRQVQQPAGGWVHDRNGQGLGSGADETFSHTTKSKPTIGSDSALLGKRLKTGLGAYLTASRENGVAEANILSTAY